ncbi:MAG: FtsW/RodA/SpoVE family cell cycle protein [Flavobacteriales bacterium]|nr:FtsW/RodA/SpoVE family cell cycle protein [Flavobacteriales bacterium]
MKAFLQSLKGDKKVWGIVFLMMVASLVIVYSAISNLAWRGSGSGQVLSMTFKHGMHLIIGLGIMYFVHKKPYKYFSSIAVLLLPVVVVMLIFTILQGNQIGGANASRWIQVPFIGMSIQTSSIATVVLYVYVARYLAKIQDKSVTFKEAFLPLWMPIIVVIVSILPANFSTAALLTLNLGIILIIGRYPIKHLLVMLVAGALLLSIFISLALKFPDAFPNRVHTWTNRVESFMSPKDGEEQYQVESAKIAVAMGGVFGQGPGKSIQKNHLPQSSSDFIYAIIIEEFGFFGAVGILSLYFVLMYRMVIISRKAPTIFGSLLVIALGIPIVLQALMNMSVAVGLMPVTGQPLPLISSGGTSIWMIAAAIGMIISVSRETQELEEKEAEGMSVIENADNNEIVNELIEGELEEVV